MIYNWQQKDWPKFSYEESVFRDKLLACVQKLGHYAGSLKNLKKDMQLETIVQVMVQEALKSSAIEAEYIQEEDIVSSIRNHYGLNEKQVFVADVRAKGVSQMMIDVYESYASPLSILKLNSWHSMLLQHYRGSAGISIGVFRKDTEPMQVVSGPYGKRRVHFEAPPSDRVEKEMKAFVKWFKQTAPGGCHDLKAAPLRAAIAHLYFLTIHPYDDGNGRVGRAIAEKSLTQGLGYPALVSLSQEIEANKKQYYSAIQQAQSSNEITAWIVYFLDLVEASLVRVEQQVDFVVNKAKFYERVKELMNERQTKVINRMLKEGPLGFEGGINARKYMSLTKCSKATSTRDLGDLLAKQVLKKRPGSGRSSSYDLDL